MYFFPVKQNVKDIFIGGHRKNKQQKVIFQNRLKKLNFKDIIENELDFHGYMNAKSEIQQQPDDINSFMCELREISYGFYNKITCHSAIPSTCVQSICLYLANLCSQGLLGF